jgi:uncharacterized protein
MRIAVFGATGQVGSRVVAEGLARGHEVTAVSRSNGRRTPSGVAVRTADATDAGNVARVSAGHDLVVGAARPAAGLETELVTVARGLLAGTATSGVRLLLVGGAGGLRVPDRPGTLAVDDPRYVPPAWRPIARACVDQLEACLQDDGADWTYASPPAVLRPGERTGAYRTGTDELLVDGAGDSSISMEDFAVALLDEAERPRHRRARFTVAGRGS